ncbi:MAG: SO2930 family diheme c-type cytochrome [Kofleriaceae bacterium]
MKRIVVLVALVALVACGDNDKPPCDRTSGEFCERLSDYALFDDIATQSPAAGVIPYDLNTPLFSDYTTKQRFFALPDGASMTWADPGAFAAPTGTIVIKTFGYLADRRMPAGDERLLETRLLVKQDDGWTGASYIYGDRTDDAELAIAGGTLDTSWIHDDGQERTNDYAVPNKNQCKNCHADHDDTIDLLGPKARHINRDGQLEDLLARGVLAGAPDASTWPKAPPAFDPQSGTLDERARAWLDINCAHCHNPNGAARTSGLYLDLAQADPFDLGVCKPPVAAGGGSGGRLFGIVPGKPDDSILMFRLESAEADVKMPEIGRNLVDVEGSALIREWIAAMPGGC